MQSFLYSWDHVLVWALDEVVQRKGYAHSRVRLEVLKELETVHFVREKAVYLTKCVHEHQFQIMTRGHNLGAKKIPWHELEHTRWIEAAQNVPAFLSSIEEPASARFTAWGSANSSEPGGSPATVFMEQYSKRMRSSRHWAYVIWDIQ